MGGGTRLQAVQVATLIDAILALPAPIDFPWHLFVTVPIAIFALLFICDESVEALNVAARTTS